MKCIVALMQHETNTFSPLTTPLQAFASGVGLMEPSVGPQAIDIYTGAGNMLGMTGKSAFMRMPTCL